MNTLNNEKKLQQLYKCPKCNNELASRRNLKRHLKIHDRPQHQCPTCPESFPNKSQLLKHKRSIHRRQKVNLKCPKCEFTSKSKTAREEHFIGVHTFRRPHKCLKCPFSTARKQSLKTHVKKCVGYETWGKPEKALYRPFQAWRIYTKNMIGIREDPTDTLSTDGIGYLKFRARYDIISKYIIDSRNKPEEK
jgi:uncharacterized Zn-finger protein